MSGAQINFLEEIIVDNFAGGGGASTGIELATGRPVTIAINHDPDAILMHKTNHPFTEHYQASVWDVDPREVSKGRPVGLAWFSPDCKHFSKAKGGKPVDKNIRGPGLDRSAVGRDRAATGDNPGERGGVPDLGACTERPPGEIQGRTDLPQMAFPTGGPGVCRGMAGTGGGGLRGANDQETVFPGGKV